MIKEDESRPSAGKQDGQATDIECGKDNSPSMSIELSALQFEGEEISFVEINGENWYTGYAVGKIVGYPYKTVTRLVRRKREIFEGLTASVTMALSGKLQLVLCFNRDGVLTFLNEVDWPSLKPDERKQKVIRFRRWMIQNTGEIIDRKWVPVDSSLAGIDPEELKCDYKSRSITNNARTRMLWHQLRLQRPHNPDTVNRTNSMYRHDYESIFGPINGTLPKGWRKKSLGDTNERTLHLKELMEFGEHMHGNIDQESVNAKVLACFKEVFPEYMPKFLKSLIDKTRQTKLLPDGES